MPRGGSGVPTIKDVALRAEVSVGTVSRVLNESQNVDAALRQKVATAIRELGYRPNVRAQSFVRERSNLIAFVLANNIGLSGSYAHMLIGIEETCAESGFHLLFTRFRYLAGQAPDEIPLPSVIASRGLADCVIVGGDNHSNLIEALQALGLSYVVLANDLGDGSAPPFNAVLYDEEGSCAEATEYLIRLGHRDIWFIGDTTVPAFRNRHRGYERAMNASGLEPHAHIVALADDPIDNGHAAMSYILEQKAPVTAVLAASDEAAHGARDALREYGKDVPRDVSLIGFEQSAGARATHLTSVRVDVAEVGRQLARMALARATSGGRDQPTVVIPASLIRRSSCRPVRPTDAMML